MPKTFLDEGGKEGLVFWCQVAYGKQDDNVGEALKPTLNHLKSTALLQSATHAVQAWTVGFLARVLL